jgi:hypothetical protein
LRIANSREKNTTVTPEAREGKPRINLGRISDHKGGKPAKLSKVSDLRIHLMQPNGTYFKSNYGRWAPSAMHEGAEATALSSKSTRLHLGHFNAVEKC